MTELIVFLVIVTAIASVLATLRDVYADGLGRRQPPASHHLSPFDAAGPGRC